CLQDMQLPLTF
nr:immunoglobulin light chain junction region [Macaca mulatta]MOW51610.1 immunoglobulin light chain junction region [Macaca mulatta]MOW52449.1 immunoglobulin light chain junction region [Macaca mulatta]MOW52452.1 immunoglobulin light chain junction region [Macaca mulatta]MOW52972.1 immunoglobulin light chain junction region [Macaca mulatta]